MLNAAYLRACLPEDIEFNYCHQSINQLRQTTIIITTNAAASCCPRLVWDMPAFILSVLGPGRQSRGRHAHWCFIVITVDVLLELQSANANIASLMAMVGAIDSF